MKLYLFGGAEIPLGQAQPLKDLIKETIAHLQPESILHIPYARLHPIEEDWKEGWFKKTMKDTGIEILDARISADVDKAKNPLIFINGGHDRAELMQSINSNQRIRNLILQAKVIVGESAGSMVVGEYLRADSEGKEIIPGLGILKNTIIEPHYSERNREQFLLQEMRLTDARFGIGIDCVTAILVDPAEFPSKWTKIGNGTVDIKLNGLS